MPRCAVRATLWGQRGQLKCQRDSTD